MKSGPTLPVHQRDLKNVRQIKFESNGYSSSPWDLVVKALKAVKNAVTVVSTGSPSDGLGPHEGSESSTSVSAFIASQKQTTAEKDGNDWVVDEIVVAGDDSDPRYGQSGHSGSERDTTTRSRHSSSAGGSVRRGTEAHGTESAEEYYQSGYWDWIRLVGWPTVLVFFNPRFEDPEQESDFQKLSWFTTKAWAFYGSMFLVVNWVLYLIFNKSSTEHILSSEIIFYGGLTLVTVPLPIMIGFDLPRKAPMFFQIWFCVAVWYCGVAELVGMKLCNFFIPAQNTCFGKNYLSTMYYITAQPAIMMFVVSKRLYNLIMQLVVLALLLGLVIPVRELFIRNVVSYVIFHIFLQGMHYSRELTERRMYLLNTQLKVAYRAQQKAQIAESKAGQAKRRFASYIFHEVRVPLNTAMLAYQNLLSGDAFKESHMQHHDSEVYALEVSLIMMQQVLNDVLDLQKMDAGHFESNPRPFPLHHVINSILSPIGVATASKNLKLHIDLDKRIDQLACLRPPNTVNGANLQVNGNGHPAEDGDGLWVIGDEIRLRQILTNLASNAVKFTPDAGGEIKISTHFLDVTAPPTPMDSTDSLVAPPMLSHGGRMEKEKEKHGSMLVFRLEVLDNGPGIKPSDLVDNRLFQPFAQTNVGKLNGKGTGLGLAIVRQIVALSGGRLGVSSRKGQGATFWVELSYPIATSSQVYAARSNSSNSMSAMSGSHLRVAIPVEGVDQWPAFVPAQGDYRAEPPKPSLGPSSTPIMGQYDSQSSPAPAHLTPPLTLPMPLNEVASARPTGILKTFLPPKIKVTAPVKDPLLVLVVDDDAMTRTLMSRMLSRLGCVVDTANDGKQCLDMLLNPNARVYDLISLDNYMPIMTGEEAVRELRALGRKDLVVGCTGNALTEDQRSYIDAGADRVLTKPIMLRDLETVLQVARTRRHAVQECKTDVSPPVPEPPS